MEDIKGKIALLEKNNKRLYSIMMNEPNVFRIHTKKIIKINEKEIEELNKLIK